MSYVLHLHRICGCPRKNACTCCCICVHWWWCTCICISMCACFSDLTHVPWCVTALIFCVCTGMCRRLCVRPRACICFCMSTLICALAMPWSMIIMTCSYWTKLWSKTSEVREYHPFLHEVTSRHGSSEATCIIGNGAISKLEAHGPDLLKLQLSIVKLLRFADMCPVPPKTSWLIHHGQREA